MSLNWFCDCLKCLVQPLYFPYLFILLFIILYILIIIYRQFTNNIIFLLIFFLCYHQLFEPLCFQPIKLSFILFKFSLKSNFLNLKLFNFLNQLFDLYTLILHQFLLLSLLFIFLSIILQLILKIINL